MKIILVSRSLQKLQTVAKEIENEFKVETFIVEVDFTSGLEIYEKIKENVRGKRIGVLVNNVGMFYTSPDLFLSIPDREKTLQDIIKCNVITTPMMCSIILPQMVRRKRGIIINVSSIVVACPNPNVTIYSASKAFMNKFSEDLSAEYEDHGIIVQSLIPGPVALTNMPKIRRTSKMIPGANDYVKSALKTVGFCAFTTGYWPHTFLLKSSQLFHFLMPATFLNVQFKIYKDYRSRETRLRGYSSAKDVY